jgi:hypothetical protein
VALFDIYELVFRLLPILFLIEPGVKAIDFYFHTIARDATSGNNVSKRSSAIDDRSPDTVPA